MSESHWNDHGYMYMYVSSADLRTFSSLCKNFAWWTVTQRASKKNIKLSKLRGWVLAGTIRYIYEKSQFTDNSPQLPSTTGRTMGGKPEQAMQSSVGGLAKVALPDYSIQRGYACS